MLNYDEQMYLVSRGLATLKNDGKYTTFKYARKAMYEYLWYQVPNLLESRGHVYCNTTKELVQAAPRKSFNYLERGYWQDVPLDTPVEMYKKVNGYLACATLHNGELVVSTTGTTASDYAMWAKELISNKYNNSLYKHSLSANHTLLFEVVVPQDPHIVREVEGLYLLGKRNKSTGDFRALGMPIYCTLEQALEITKHDRGEGFMMYPMLRDGTYDYNNCCKLKSDYYVGKKKLMRMTAKNIEIMYENPDSIAAGLPEMWYHAVQYIVHRCYKEMWLQATDQQRRVILENLKGV